jgi:A/G-specific adenine glycosylase
MDIAPALRRWLRRRLLAWFGRHRRDLPWRRDRDPYRIWVSEVMLQQTQVAAVIPFYLRFLQSFPTLTALAAAAEQDILGHWEGLGYYRRARDLHRAARTLAAGHDGKVPDDPVEFGRLPGVGRYILGAVLSQAFNRRLPILEANSLRVLSRFFGLRDDPRSGQGQRRLWRAAELLLPAREVGDFNQALMELGALVCTPATPRCGACPLAGHCAARREGLQEVLPRRPAPPEVVPERRAAVVVRRGGRVLLARRPERGRWAGLWEFPHGPLRTKESFEAGAERLLPELTGLLAELGQELLTVRHSVTRFRITLVCFQAEYRGGEFASAFYPEGRWVEPGRLTDYPVSVPQRRLAHALVGARQKHLF